MTNNTNAVMILTQNIKRMLNEMQELSEDHFNLSPECIRNKQVEELQTVHRWLKATLKKARRVAES